MTILSFDIESCNGNSNEASLCSFGYCLFNEKFEVLQQKDILVNPTSKRFTLTNYKGTKGIKLAYEESVFRAAPTFDKVYEDIKQIFKKAELVIGFSITNDLKFLNSACKHYNLPSICFDFIDVQYIYSLYSGEQKGLNKLMEEMSKDFVFHESDEDARATVLVLQNLCNKMHLDINGLIGFYRIIKGKNTPEGYVNSFSLKQMLGKEGLKPTTKISKYLFNSHLVKQKRKKGALNKLKVHFSKKLCYGDVKFSRSLITYLYDNGGIYSSNIEECDVFIITSKEKLKNTELEFATNNEKKVIEVKDFMQTIPNFKMQSFNDEKMILDFLSKKITE